MINTVGAMDNVMGYTYFGARYYDSDLSVWLSVDPMAGEYPNMSPYMYVAGNPIRFIDPNGSIIWDPIAEKEVVYNENTNSFMYADGSKLSSYFKRRSLPTLKMLSNSEVGRKIIRSWQKSTSRIIIDDQEGKNSRESKDANSIVGPTSEGRTSDGLYEEIVITPIWRNIKKNAKEDGMGVEEKFIAVMTVEWGHYSSQAQIVLEISMGGLKEIKSDPSKYATVYNKLLNDAIRAEMEFRNETGIPIDKSVFNPVLKVQNSSYGSGIKLDESNQAAYDKLQN